MNVYRVPTRLIPDLWPGLVEFVERACEHHPFIDAEDALVILLSGQAQLFLATDEAGIQGFAAAEVVQYPRRKVANVLAAGGKRGFLSVAVHEVLPALKAWGAEHGADTFAISGRPGWVRALRSEGFQVVSHIVMWTDLDGQKGRRKTDHRIGAVEGSTALSQ